MRISGTQLSEKLKSQMAVKVERLKSEFGRVPSLAVILVGEDPASLSYVKGKAKACEVVGIKNATIMLPSDISQEELLAKIMELNNDGQIDGILVQLPLPKHIDAQKVIETISVEKDVDGFHPSNVASLWLGNYKEKSIPCTPKGIIKLLEEAGETIEGKHAVVVGRSKIVGLPVAKLLLDKNATVTIAHSKTKNLGSFTSQADILVVAAGHPHIICEDMVKPGAVVIDVGINRDSESGKLCGDVDTEKVEKKARCITPVPGGVGPMTICCLIENVIECFQRRHRL